MEDGWEGCLSVPGLRGSRRASGGSGYRGIDARGASWSAPSRVFTPESCSTRSTTSTTPHPMWIKDLRADLGDQDTLSRPAAAVPPVVKARGRISSPACGCAGRTCAPAGSPSTEPGRGQFRLGLEPAFDLASRRATVLLGPGSRLQSLSHAALGRRRRSAGPGLPRWRGPLRLVGGLRPGCRRAGASSGRLPSSMSGPPVAAT